MRLAEGSLSYLTRWLLSLRPRGQSQGEPPLFLSLGSSPFPSTRLRRSRTLRRAVCLSWALPESANKTCPPPGTTAHPVASLLAWPAWLPPLSTPAAPPFGPILSPLLCPSCLHLSNVLSLWPAGSAPGVWTDSLPVVTPAQELRPLVSALPTLTSPSKANIWEG